MLAELPSPVSVEEYVFFFCIYSVGKDLVKKCTRKKLERLTALLACTSVNVPETNEWNASAAESL